MDNLENYFQKVLLHQIYFNLIVRIKIKTEISFFNDLEMLANFRIVAYFVESDYFITAINSSKMLILTKDLRIAKHFDFNDTIKVIKMKAE